MEKAMWDDDTEIACVVQGQDPNLSPFRIPVDSSPPKHCPFYLEHLMENKNAR